MGVIVFENGSDGLFDMLNEIFELQTQHDVSIGNLRTNFDTMVTNVSDEFTSTEFTQSFASAEATLGGEESQVSAMSAALRSVCEQVLIEKVDEAVQLPSRSLQAALLELAEQMEEESESLKEPTVSIAATPDGGNTGDGVLLVTAREVNGNDNPAVLAETIVVDASLQSSNLSVSLAATSSAVSTALSPNDIGGSGLSNATIRPFTTSTGLTGFGSLPAFTTSASVLPSNWIANVGALGTAVKSGQPEEATVAITGTPTAGSYRITCQTTSLGTQSTYSLPYNATAATVQAAIQAMTGFSKISVTSVGTTPNYTHTIKFYGMRESVTVAVVNDTTGGTVTPNAAVLFDSPSLGGSPLVLVSDGSTLVSASIELTHLLPRTCYAVNAWLALNAASASGVVEISLTNGVGGSILQDDAGNNLSITVDASSLTTSYQSAAKLTAGVPFFMTPTTMPASVYLRIRTSTTLVNTRRLLIENPIVAVATRFYAGGPFFAAFAGPDGFKDGDTWSVAASNDYGGKVSWMMERNFGLRSKGIVLPHTALGTITELTPYTAAP